MVVRCELDSVIKRKKGQETVLMVRALNEYDSRVSGSDYRQKLENQRGAVVATELKNNANTNVAEPKDAEGADKAGAEFNKSSRGLRACLPCCFN